MTGETGVRVEPLQWTENKKLEGKSRDYRTSGPPALAVFKDTLYCINEGRKNDGWLWWTYIVSGKWTEHAKVTEGSNKYVTSGPPALAVFKEKLYCIHEGRGKDGWLWGTSYDGGKWSKDEKLRGKNDAWAYGTTRTPALAVFGDKLYCIHEGRDHDGWLWCTVSSDGETWSKDQRLKGVTAQYGTTGGPALAVYKGKLYCLHQGRGQSGWSWVATTEDGETWTKDSLCPNKRHAYGISGSPSLVVYRDKLICVREGRGKQGEMWEGGFDGEDWFQDQLMPNEQHPFKTTGPPALAVFQDRLHCVHEGSGHDGWLWGATAK